METKTKHPEVLILIITLVSEIMEKETQNKWKCNGCEILLASKQTALKHVKRFHKDSDPAETILKVKVPVSGEKSKQVP